jgi:L-asparaginase II
VFHAGVPASEPLVRVFRGALEESVHRGALVVWERGRATIVRGDRDRLVYYRSASKPLQALEVVAGGAADAYGLSPSEIAIAAGSHNAEPRHVEAARSILRKAGLDESALRCGGHRSVNSDVAFAQRRDGVAITSIVSNCSGKHAAMLAASKHAGAPLETYLDPDHPVQRAIRGHVATFAAVDGVHVGIDGCGAPAFAVPLEAMARSIARFAAPDDAVPAPLAAAARRVADAMLRHPEMIAGLERFDTDLMASAPGVLAKAGAEGVHVVAVPERALGLAVKVDDGSDRGYRAVVVEVLRRLGVLADGVADGLRERHAPAVVRNLAGAPVGRLVLAF